MRNIDGLEMVCFCKSKHFEMTYGGGGKYVNPKNEPVEDLFDMNCYVCTASFFTTEGDAILFCPNCGHFDRKRFNHKHELVEALRGQDFSWLKRNKPIAVEKFDGVWELKFAPSALHLDQTGSYKKVVEL